MLSLALSMAVLSSSGGLLSGYESRHVRLIDATEVVGGVVLGQYAPAPQSLEQLRAQLLELEENLPTFTAPIVLAAVGVGLLLTMTIVAYVGYLSLGVWILVGVGYIAGVVLAIIGGVMIGTTAGRRGRANREIRTLQQQIQQMEASGGGGYQPLPTGPMPPPPPSSLLLGPSSHMVVAQF